MPSYTRWRLADAWRTREVVFQGEVDLPNFGAIRVTTVHAHIPKLEAVMG